LRYSLRSRLIATFLVLIVIVGAVTLFLIERTLAADLITSLEDRMVRQARGVSDWLRRAGHPDQLAPRLGRVTSARITIVDKFGVVVGDSINPELVGTMVEHAPEFDAARKDGLGRAERALVEGKPPYYLVAVSTPDTGHVIRMAVPLSDAIATRERMRRRLLVGSILGLVGALFLSAVFLRAVTRPLQSMSRAAERMALGDYDTAPPAEAMAAGGELAVLARSITHLAEEVKLRIGDLTKQRDLLRGVVGALVEGVVVLDNEGKIVLVNDAALPLVSEDGRRTNPEGSAAKTEAEAIPLPASLAPLVSEALASRRAPTESEREPHDAEVSLRGRAVRASCIPLRESRGAVVVLYDVTRLRALEGQSREFLASAAHELRTPVTAISGSAETLLGGAADPATAKEFLEVIHRNAQRIATLVSDLLVLEGLEARAEVIGERGLVALAPVVTDAVRTTRAVTPNLEIEVDVPEDIVVMGTRDGLDHVVQNLVDNAAKHGGGMQIEIRATTEAARVVLAVSDRGPGIAPQHHARIFERFYRVDPGRSRRAGGSGLGLAIVKSQAEAMGGSVRVESEVGKGATFIVELEPAPPITESARRRRLL
jgi:two-component system phosphate regulon sensor histidine kinase PhoR